MTLPSAWRKSSYSDGQDTCVAVHRNLAAVRDTKHRGPHLTVDVRALVDAIRSGRLG